LLISNAAVITFSESNPIIFDGAIYIRGGVIQDIGSSSVLEKKYLDVEKYNANGQIILPGMIIPHFHIYGTFARGIPLKDDPPQNFLQNLKRLWWRLDKQLTPEEIRYSAYVALIDCIKAGTTTIFDHHASPYSISGILDILAEVFTEIGLRGCLCYEVSDRDGEKSVTDGINENIRFTEFCANDNSGFLTSCFGLHASFTLSDQTLVACKEVAEGCQLGFHFHLGEGQTDRLETKKQFGYDSPVVRLNKLRILNNRTIVAHAIDVNDDELKILKENGVTVVHNPQSNMNNGVGFADIEIMMDLGILAGLGTDGMTTNLFREIQAACLLPKHEKQNPSVGGDAIKKIIFENHKSIVSNVFNTGLGEIKVGNRADLIFFNYKPPTPMNEDNVWYHLLFGFGSSCVNSTMVDGKFLMKNREILVCDEKRILAAANNVAKRLWERF